MTLVAEAPPATRPTTAPVQRNWSGGVGRLVLGVAGIAAALGAWQLASLTHLLPASTVPAMTTVVGEYRHLLADPVFWSSLGHTVSSWLIGCVLSCLVAIPLGILIGTSRFADDSTRGVLEFLKPIPPIALIPVALLLWGPSTTMKLTLIAFGATRVLLIQVVYGVRAVDQVALSMARSYRLGRVQTLRRVVLPGMSPYIVTGLRVSAAVALIVTIVTEMVGGVPGLGRGILEAQNSNALPRMYAMVLFSGILGLAANGCFELIERRMLRWHPSRRGDSTR